MSQVLHERDVGEGSDPGQRAKDVAALLHFSIYIAKEASRLGIPAAAEKARMIEEDLLLALVRDTDGKDKRK
ncbi:hypothetical protein Sa4125_08440 [Aureimonas sp. SA4125]|uniref:hypothetical protein n=1 Tax=Aureimonas sp. SA4125 TaxID=2826993 RepID=UPI001CC61E32|nr:hypothetical protein [Aureimonas sp. SA4125]BDA83302.1 hypothetical protein Sa4125_08440 [Aureimonas sp. SA4125]